jgi:hypothetical protein
MTKVVPETVVNRIFAFMLTEKTGSIELHFNRGQLRNFRVIESIQIGAIDPGLSDRDTTGLDSDASVSQDTPR